MSYISRPEQPLGWGSPCHRLHTKSLRFSCYLLTIGQVSTDHRPSVVRLSSESRPTIDCYIDRVSTDYRLLYWPSLDRVSTAISTDRSVDTTYIKQNPKFLGRELGVSGSAEPSILILMSKHLAILCPLTIIIWSCIPLQLQGGSKTSHYPFRRLLLPQVCKERDHV